MPRYRLTIAYDGTDFVGWQKQSASPETGEIPRDNSHDEHEGPVARAMPPAPPARAELRSVQGVVEQAVRETVRQPIVLIGASRTDSGVHARFQTAAFTMQEQTTADGRRIGPPDDRLMEAINSRLPADVLVTSCVPVEPAFDPIKDCLCKGYRYSLWVSPQRPLWEREQVWHQRGPLDVDAMAHAARLIEGTHDFGAFAAAGHGRESTVRTVLGCRAARGAGELVEIDVAADGFLWNMVRIIAGTLVDVGRGKLAPSDIPGIIESKDRRRAGATAPARGLCLMWACYPEDKLDALPDLVRARVSVIESRRENALAARRERSSRPAPLAGDAP